MKMRHRSLLPVTPAIAAAAIGLSVAHPAHAQTACTSLPHPVIVAGSSAVKPFLQKLAGQLAGTITIIYPNNTGSCDGVGFMATSGATITGTGAVYWDSTGAPVSGGCDFSLSGDVVDIGVSDVYASTCGKTVASDVTDFHGPIQVMTMAVPLASTATSISAEAAYMVYGFGGDAAHQVAPWTDPAAIFQRDSASGTQSMTATAIGVPPAQWLPAANTSKTSDIIFNAMLGASDPAKAIGILSTAYADLHRDKVRVLAYQHKGQSCGYLPDSSSTALDKANVRDGHYAIWGPLHMYAHTSSGKAINADAQTVIDALTMAADPGFDLIKVEAKNGVIPDCAMHVSRTTEVGDMASYQPAASCECKYLAEATGTAPAECKTCTVATQATDCPSTRSHCNYGYCEAK